MDMEMGNSVLAAQPELVDQFAAIDDAVTTVADVLIAIEEMDEQSPLAMSLARAARAYLCKVDTAKSAIFDACRSPLALAETEEAQPSTPDLSALDKGKPRITAEALRMIEADFLRPDKPSFASCYRRLVNDFAIPRGITLPSMQAVKRMLDQHSGRMAQIQPAPRR